MPRVALTDRFVAGAKAPSGSQVDYFDETITGLALRVSAGGRKTWTFNFTSPRDGKRARASIGSYPAASLAAARGRAIEARQQIEAGSDPRVLGPRGAADMTVTELVQTYLADPEKAALRTVDEISRRLQRNVTPFIGDVRLTALTRRDVRNVTDRIMKRGKPSETSHVFEDIRAMLRWAVKADYIERNPIEGVDKPGGNKPGDRALSDAEIAILWSGLPQALARSKACQRILKLVLVTAQRPGECAGMGRSEVDLENRLWSLPASRTKNGHAHAVPLNDLAISVIQEAMTDAPTGEYLFRADNGSLSSDALARTVVRARQATTNYPLGRFGIADWSAHDLRRTALTGLAKLGVAPQVIGHVANHRSVTKSGVTFAHYIIHTYEKEKRTALDQWSERLMSIVAPESSS